MSLSWGQPALSDLTSRQRCSYGQSQLQAPHLGSCALLAPTLAGLRACMQRSVQPGTCPPAHIEYL